MLMDVTRYCEEEDSQGNPYKRLRYIQTMDNDGGVLTLRTYATKIVKGKRVYQLAIEETMDKVLMNGSMYCGNMAGWRIVMPGETKHCSYYGTIPHTDVMYKYSGAPNVFSTRIWDNDKIRSFKGFEYIDKEFVPIENTMKFLKRWIEYKDLEMFCKAGMTYVYSDRRFLTLKGDKRKRFLEFVRRNIDGIRDYKPNYNEIAAMIRENITIEEYRAEAEFRGFVKAARQDAIRDYREAFKYCKRNKVWASDYRDYARLCESAGWEFDGRIAYPTDFEYAHDNVSKFVKDRESRETDLLMRKIAKQFGVISKDGFKVVVANSTKQLVKVGNTLSICVGSAGYNRRMAEGKCLIILIYKGNDICECCELKPKEKRYEMVQLRGEHNQPSEYHDKCQMMVNKFIRQYNIASI